jgi:transcriptional regulator with XRE-family HTH domain
MNKTATPHPICRLLRDLRIAAHLSLQDIEEKFDFSGVVLGAYERGDRVPPLTKLEKVLGFYGYHLQAVPMGQEFVRLSGDVVADLRAIAHQLEESDALRPVS